MNSDHSEYNFVLRDLEFSDKLEVIWATKNYCENPGYWEENWSVDQAAINKTIFRINDARADEAQRFLIAENLNKEIVGFHWLSLKTAEVGAPRYQGFEMNLTETTYAQIIHLWVHDDFYGKGIAAQIKEAGELWAKNSGATRIQASVHSRNQRMLELNTRLGFAVGNVMMSKKL